MRRILCLISAVAASVIFTAAPALSEESTMGQSEQRDECLLVARNCSDNVDSYQQRIERLNTEISKGTTVYTEDELRILNQKRDAIYEQMRDLLENS